MPSIDSTSTLAEVKAAYCDNADYDVAGSRVKAGTFLVACRQLLLRLSKRVAHGNRAEEIEIDPLVIERQIAACQRWMYSQQARSNGQIQRVFRRDTTALPTYPGPYWGN